MKRKKRGKLAFAIHAERDLLQERGGTDTPLTASLGEGGRGESLILEYGITAAIFEPSIERMLTPALISRHRSS